MNFLTTRPFGQRKHLQVTKDIALANLVQEAEYLVANYRIVGLIPSKINGLRRALIQLKLAEKVK